MSNILTYKFNKEGLYNIYITSNILITNMSCMFCDCSSLQEINLSSFNTSNATNMELMFCKCSSLKKINLSSFNTNNVTDMSEMFSDIPISCNLKCNDRNIVELFNTKNKNCFIF